MNEITKDTFWETDLSDLPWAIEINDKTPIISQWATYTQEGINKWVDHILNK